MRKLLIVLALASTCGAQVINVRHRGAAAPSGPSFVYSDAYYTTPSSGAFSSRNFTATAGQRAVAFAAYTNGNTGCSSLTLSAQTSGGTSVPAVSAFASGIPNGYVCIWLFDIASLPTTQTEHFNFSGATGISYIVTGMLTWTGGSGTQDGTCSGTGTSSPMACSAGITPTDSDIVVGVYAGYNHNSNTLGSSTLTVGGVCTATPGTSCGKFVLGSPQTGYLPTVAIGYATTASSITPSFTDTGAIGDAVAIGAVAHK
jgi:hypothetical protein